MRSWSEWAVDRRNNRKQSQRPPIGFYVDWGNPKPLPERLRDKSELVEK